jgi:glucose-6-phosphate isomerase
VDIVLLCRGAAEMVARVTVPEPRKNPAALHAALLWLACSEHGASMHVLMPYSRRLVRMGHWYVQLWAESLGKRRSLDGRDVFVGQTPICAEGATDQHSQVQLFVEGPFDKVVTLIRVEDHGRQLEIPHDLLDIESVAYLCGHDLGALLNMEQRATELALVEASRLTSVITLDRVDEVALGSLFMFFEVQTVVMGALMGIDALDQPGVEAGKRLTSAMAGRTGYEDDARRVRDMLARKREDLIVG